MRREVGLFGDSLSTFLSDKTSNEDKEKAIRSNITQYLSRNVTKVTSQNVAEALKTTKNVNLYIHIPFCDRRCSFCHFPLIINNPLKREAYVSSFEQHVETLLSPVSRPKFDSIFMGGGTPSVLSLEQIARILSPIKRQADISGAPFTFEMHPKNVTLDYLRGLQESGVSRISIGFQNSNLDERTVLNRNLTTPEQDIDALALIKRFGLPFNVDLMYGTPEQSLESWSDSLKSLVEQIRPPEITTYLYINIPGTGTDFQIRKGVWKRPSLRTRADMHLHTIQYLASQGYTQVGAMSFALTKTPDRSAQLKENANFLGLGPGSYSNLGDKVFVNTAPVRQFIDGGYDNFICIQRSLLFKSIFDFAYNNLVNNITLAKRLRLQQLQPEVISQVYGVYYNVQDAYSLNSVDYGYAPIIKPAISTV